MFKEVRFERYRCFRDATLRFGRLTFLVGPNASGKSSLLRGLVPHPVGAVSRWQHGLVPVVRHWSTTDGKNFSLREMENGSEHLLRGAQHVHFDPTRMRMPVTLQDGPKLGSDGGNLANVLSTLPRSEQDRVASELRELVPAVGDFGLKPINGQHRIVFEDGWRRGTWYEAEEVSDGTMLVLGYLAIVHQLHAPSLITIEEPERGLHPFLLGELINLLRGLSEGRFGKQAVQVVAATHSADLLDHLRPEEVRFLKRNSEDGSVDIVEAQTDTPDWALAYKEYQQSLGDMWLSGGLGGVPARAR